MVIENGAVAVRVDVDSTCGCATTPICEVAGVELSVAPRRPPHGRRVVTRLAWVPYGDRVSDDAARATYAAELMGLLKALLGPDCKPSAGGDTDQLRQV